MKTLLFALAATFLATVASAQSSYQIRPGDTLAVEVLEDPSLNRSLLVLPDGSISFPYVGSVQAGGHTSGAVAASISKGIASNFATTPNVLVTVKSVGGGGGGGGKSSGSRGINVFMMGQIAKPGERQFPRGTTLLQALSSTGGFTKFAATKRIVLRRTDPKTGKQVVYHLNYQAIADGAAGSNDAVLADGDVIIVPERRLFE